MAGMVEICEERCRGGEGLLRLKRWLPIMERYAEKLGILIRADFPDGRQDIISDRSSMASRVFLHLNAYPSYSNLTAKKAKPVSIFGYKAPEDFSFSEVVPALMFAPVPAAFLDTRPIRSPEDAVIGNISGSDIFINPGVLIGWPGCEDMRVLSAILYWVLPDAAFGSSGLNLDHATSAYLAGGYRKIKTSLRARLLSRKSKKDINVGIRSFLALGMISRITRLNREADLIIGEAAEKRVEYFKSLELIHDLEERLETATRASLKRDFSEEFEKIMAMADVLSVRFLRSENPSVQKLLIMTGPINQMPDDGKLYDIGEFDIEIDFKNPGRAGIKFWQTRNVGGYQHPHSLPGGDGFICFGSRADRGLNGDIDYLAKCLEVAPLVHLLLTFLKKEIKAPKQKTNENVSAEPPLPLPPPLYGSEEERLEQKDLFIGGMRDVVLSANTALILQNLAKENQTVDKISGERDKLRLEAKEIELSIESIGSRVGGERELAMQETELLLNDGNVLSVAADGDEMRIHFDVYDPARPESVRGAKGYILIIKRDRPPYIFHSSGKTPTFITDILGIGGKPSDPMKLTERKLIGIQSRGNFYELLSAVKGLIINGFLD